MEQKMFLTNQWNFRKVTMKPKRMTKKLKNVKHVVELMIPLTLTSLLDVIFVQSGSAGVLPAVALISPQL